MLFYSFSDTKSLILFKCRCHCKCCLLAHHVRRVLVILRVGLQHGGGELPLRPRILQDEVAALVLRVLYVHSIIIVNAVLRIFRITADLLFVIIFWVP